MAVISFNSIKRQSVGTGQRSASLAPRRSRSSRRIFHWWVMWRMEFVFFLLTVLPLFFVLPLLSPLIPRISLLRSHFQLQKLHLDPKCRWRFWEWRRSLRREPCAILCGTYAASGTLMVNKSKLLVKNQVKQVNQNRNSCKHRHMTTQKAILLLKQAVTCLSCSSYRCTDRTISHRFFTSPPCRLLKRRLQHCCKAKLGLPRRLR